MATPAPLAILLGIAAIALVLRLVQLGQQSFWIDEMRAVVRVDDLPLLDNVRRVFGPFDPPLSYVLTELTRGLPFSLEFSGRLPACIAGAAEVLGVGLLLHRLTGRRTEPIIAALLLAVAPFAIRYGQEARYYTLFSAVHLFSWIAFIDALRRRRSWWPWAIVMTIALYTHVFAFALLAIQAAIVGGIAWRKARPKELVNFAVAAAAALVAFAPWMIYESLHWIGRVVAGDSIAFNPQDDRSVSFVGDFPARAASWLLGNNLPWHSTLGLVLASLAALAPFVARGDRRRVGMMGVAYVLIWCVCLGLATNPMGTYFAFRRVEFLVPVLLALVAIAIVGVAERTADRFSRRFGTAALVGLTAVLVLGSLGASRSYFRTEKTNYLAAVAAIKQSPTDATVVLGPFHARRGTSWDPAIRRYLAAHGIERPIVSVDELDVDALASAGEMVWITGAAPDSHEFDATPLNNVDNLQPLAGDSSMGPPFVIPLYLLRSEYSSPAELRGQADAVRGLPFLLPTEG